jgi:hypothetical protein
MKLADKISKFVTKILDWIPNCLDNLTITNFLGEVWPWMGRTCKEKTIKPDRNNIRLAFRSSDSDAINSSSRTEHIFSTCCGKVKAKTISVSNKTKHVRKLQRIPPPLNTGFKFQTV